MSNIARDVIVALRGGIPKRCDFCLSPTAPDQLHPEEAGDWACETCLARWDAEDAKRNA